METSFFVFLYFLFMGSLHYLVYSFTSNFELLLTRGIRLFNKNKALRNFFWIENVFNSM